MEKGKQLCFEIIIEKCMLLYNNTYVNDDNLFNLY